jgi:hypothetical protein
MHFHIIDTRLKTADQSQENYVNLTARVVENLCYYSVHIIKFKSQYCLLLTCVCLGLLFVLKMEAVRFHFYQSKRRCIAEDNILKAFIFLCCT